MANLKKSEEKFIDKELYIMIEQEEVNIDIAEYISEENLNKFLKKIGHTNETFEDSELKKFIESMIYGAEKTIHEETLKLMKENNLTYGEAKNIVTPKIIEAIREGLKKDLKGENNG